MVELVSYDTLIRYRHGFESRSRYNIGQSYLNYGSKTPKNEP